MDAEKTLLRVQTSIHGPSGHMIPTVDMARIFAARGLSSTIITAHLKAAYLAGAVERSKTWGLEIKIQTVKFPVAEAGLPEGCENFDFLTSTETGQEELMDKFFDALGTLRDSVCNLLEASQPNRLVADMFFPRATNVASEFGIRRIVFYSTCYFSMCVSTLLRLHNPHKEVSSDTEPLTVPELPSNMQLTRQQLPVSVRQEV